MAYELMSSTTWMHTPFRMKESKSAFVFSDMQEEVRREKEAEDMFCLKGVTYEGCYTKSFFQA